MALLKTFTDVARYWQVEKFDLGDVFGEGEKVAVFGSMTYQSTVLGKAVSSPFAVIARVRDGKIVYAQFMGDTLATARSFPFWRNLDDQLRPRRRNIRGIAHP